jgi:hypothetical protein
MSQPSPFIIVGFDLTQNRRCRRFVAGNRLRAFGREPYLPANKCQSMRAVQSSGINVWQRFLCDEIDDRERLISPAAVDRHVGYSLNISVAMLLLTR